MQRTRYCILLILASFFSHAEAAPKPDLEQSSFIDRWGIGAGIAIVPFIGGMSGPETPLSPTRYEDTFDVGYGLRLEGYYNWSSMLRTLFSSRHGI